MHLETFDILKRLNDMNTRHILTAIFAYLTPQDLGKCMQVSQSWNVAILLDKEAIERYSVAKEWSMDQNNIDNKHICSRLIQYKNGTNTVARKPLESVCNLILSPVKHKEHQQRRSPRLLNNSPERLRDLGPSVVVSPSKFRHKLFADVSYF